MLRRILEFWIHRVYPSLVSLVAAVGVVGLVVCLAISWILAQLFEEVWEREAFAFDQTFLLWLHQFANPRLDQIMLTITRLGNPGVVAIVGITVFAILVWRRQRQEAAFFAVACLGGVILSNGLKLLFSKPRPELWKRLIAPTSFSFPSGHAMGSVVLYGIIAYLLARHYPRCSTLIYGVAIGLILAISFSRLYLGVHWLTDVIAGWGVGFLWIMICITMLKLRTMRA